MIERFGVARVLAAVQDPNPLVDGKGFQRLAQADIAVDVGLLEIEARRLNEPFFHVHALGRPLVTLKAAISLDGMIAAAAGESRWITGPSARRFAHWLRLSHDAVLVGAETVRRDDPRLTVRLAGTERSRLRVVLSHGLDLDPGARIFAKGSGGAPPARLYTAAEKGDGREQAFADRAEVVRVRRRGGHLDSREVLADLAGCGVQAVLVEGGGRTFSSFMEAGLADRAALFLAGRLLGARGGTALIEGQSAADPASGWKLTEPRQLALGRDLLLMGRLESPRPGTTESPCSPA
jgi:diaminohydroxyphosphoribosylaminopyrimidine deaminase/5-amino-6-(5-phosphoribosylamino)uracil reductase